MYSIQLKLPKHLNCNVILIIKPIKKYNFVVFTIYVYEPKKDYTFQALLQP